MELDFPDFSGRGSDEIEIFCLFVEQLEEAVESLKSGRLARQRMALVALDNLAEVLLHEFAENTFLASDQSAWLPGPRFSHGKRRKIGGDFRRRVALASQPAALSGLYPAPLLDELDASVFRVAHRYRNDLYHAGRHNRALIGALGQLYAEALGRAFIRSHSEGHTMGGGIKERLRELDRFEWRDVPSRDTFTPRDAATRIVRQICSFLDLVPLDLAEELADDLEDRCSALAAELDGLREEGLQDSAIQLLFESVQLWAAHRGDEELLRIEEERRELILGTSEAGLDDARRDEFLALERAEVERVGTLEREFVFPLKFDERDAIRKGGTALRRMTSVPTIVLRYHELDERLDQLERAVGWMLVVWDQQVQYEEDLRRGK